jgi:uncharacterized LabA/DUF88 family protein
MGQRVAMYVDGFNLYYGMRTKGWKRYFWLDLVAVASSFLNTGQELAAVHYFTSRIRDDGGNAQDRLRQTTYIDALVARGVQLHEGHFLAKKRHCKACSATWDSYEEKLTDVNIATQLVIDAYAGNFDVAFVVSGDSDLTTPVARIRAAFPQRQVVVLFPPARRSTQLEQAASGVIKLGEALLRQSQLPATVTTASGYVLKRPDHWQ